MRLILLRHAESKHGVEKFIAGKIGCKGLTDKGIQQAEKLALRLQAEQVQCDVLLSTSVRRAQETAAIVAGKLNQAVNVNDDLCELLPGDADGLSWEAYQNKFGAFDFVSKPDKPFSPNGESWNQFVTRVQTTLNTLQQTYNNQDVIAVTHGGFIVVVFLLLFDISPSIERKDLTKRAMINPAYTSITEWHVTNDAWELVRFNDVSHL